MEIKQVTLTKDSRSERIVAKKADQKTKELSVKESEILGMNEKEREIFNAKSKLIKKLNKDGKNKIVYVWSEDYGDEENVFDSLSEANESTNCLMWARLFIIIGLLSIAVIANLGIFCDPGVSTTLSVLS